MARRRNSFSSRGNNNKNNNSNRCKSLAGWLKKKKKKKVPAPLAPMLKATRSESVAFEELYLKTCQVAVSQVPVNHRWLICRY